MGKKLMVAAALVVSSIFLLYSFKAGAMTGQPYMGDGATYNPSGGWLYTQAADSSCLTCHAPGGTASNKEKTSYLMTGHKNAMRIIPLASCNDPSYGDQASCEANFGTWTIHHFGIADPAGVMYSTDVLGNPFNWADDTISISGFCTIPLYTNQSSCQSGGGAWFSGTQSLYFITGGWMNALPGSVFDTTSNQAALAFNCGRCHATGFKMDGTIQEGCSFSGGVVICRNPGNKFPGITWTSTNSSGKVNLDPDGNGPAVSSSWAGAPLTGQSLEGVQCERCHEAPGHGSGALFIRKGPAATALCLQCHRQEHTVGYAGAGLGSNIHPSPYMDNGTIAASEPVYPLPAIEVGGPDGGYAPRFYGYSTGMEYLNSVHAEFTGSYQQISDYTRYSSPFVTSSVDGGCTKCHDVHQSTVAAVNAAASYKKTCPDCHADLATQATVTIRHPQGEGTPLGDLANMQKACANCHMPKLDNGASRASHIWRISTDASYTTLPSEAEWNAGQKTANTLASGAYADAVWLDLDLACGRCHNDLNPATRPAQHYFSKAGLAAKAEGIHLSSTQWPTECVACHTGGGDADAPQINPSVNHHSGGCTGCHENPGVSQFNITIDSCLSCHGPANPLGLTIEPVEQGINHHNGNCTTCHTTPGVTQFTTETSSCLSCHSAAQGSIRPVSYATLNHPTHFPSTPNKCADCHIQPGVAVSSLGVDAVCGKCHGGGASEATMPGSLAAGAPYRTNAILSAIAQSMHDANNTAPVVNSSFLVSGETGMNVSVYDASTDADDPALEDVVKINWGDGSISTGKRGATFSHTYTRAKTYTVAHSVYDGLQSDSKIFTVTVPNTIMISGSVDVIGDADSGVTLILKYNGHTKQRVKSGSNGSFTFTKVRPITNGKYSISAYKYHVNFSNPTLVSTPTITDVSVGTIIGTKQ